MTARRAGALLRAHPEVVIAIARIARALALLAAAMGAALAAAPDSSVTLTVLHTSDLHGRVDPHDELADRDSGEGLARVASVVRAIRAEGGPTLLLDSGDTIQGSPMQALALRAGAGDGSDPTIRAMNLLRYDAMAVGNHEFDFGRARLEQSRRESRFPWLAANVLSSGRTAFDPYAVRTVAGVRVGILGLITRDVASWESASHVEGLRFTDSVEEARRWVPVLRGRERCDLVIVLTHQGFERDPETGADRGNAQENQAYALATEVPGIDLLLTGHTHTLIEPRRLGSAWVSQPGRFGNALTRFDVRFERRGGRWAVGGVVGKNLSTKGVEADGETRSVVESEHRAAMEALARPVATLAVRLTAAGARTSDTALLDWLHSVQLREGKADLSFASLLPGGLSPWDPGPLTLRQVWSFYPYENTLVTVRATGRQIRRALETAARCVSGIGEQGGRPVWKRNPSVWGYNCDTLAGADYALDPTRAERNRLLFLKRKGALVGDEESFSVAINSYRAAGGGGYGVWRDCPRLSESRQTLRELLVEDARARVTLRPAEDRNWLLAPSLPEGSFSFP